MDFLELKNIGKIYVTKNNVSVGIRNVNLSFNRGEFVVITGKSGSGKTTLLNVISGMDTYEEGELLIEGNPTSHYMQSDWEEYLEKYISFIFQDYNIIDSFTVLQNVELALMHIKDKKIRKRRAIELIEKVGLSDFLNQKGSQLSGGQKQRTVIARALAKDSPMILADEPTGNLDSETSKEIIELLKSVSQNKLVIVVTHSLSQFKSFATREIRIYDGNVEIDNHISNELNLDDEESNYEINSSNIFKNGFNLGKNLFTSKPKLAAYMSSLMIIGMIFLFSITSYCSTGFDIYKEEPMFNYSDGRVIIVKKDGTNITDNELKQLETKYKAKSSIHYDYPLDDNNLVEFYGNSKKSYIYGGIEKNINYGKCDYGTYPTLPNQLMLYLPVEYRKYQSNLDYVYLNMMKYEVTGIKYFNDNNKKACFVLTDEGYKIASAAHFLIRRNLVGILDYNNSNVKSLYLSKVFCSFEVPKDKYLINDENINSRTIGDYNFSLTITYINNYEDMDENIFHYKFTKDDIEYKTNRIFFEHKSAKEFEDNLIIGTDIAVKITEELIDQVYKQASLFFKNDKQAKKAMKEIKKAGYITALSSSTYHNKNENVISIAFVNTLLVILWVLSIWFISLFLYLCASRSLNTFKNDLAIMRSMGIKEKEIKIAIIARMFIATIPSLIILIVMPIVIYNSSYLNPLFPYLYWYDYLLILSGIILICIFICKKSIKKIFKTSVKNALRGE